MLQQGLLNAGMITDTRGFAVMPPLPEADLALVNAKCCTKGALGQASQHTGSAELASCDEVRGRLHEAFLRLANGRQEHREPRFHSVSGIIPERSRAEKHYERSIAPQS